MDTSDDNFGTIDITINDNKKNPTKSSIVIEINAIKSCQFKDYNHQNTFSNLNLMLRSTLG